MSYAWPAAWKPCAFELRVIPNTRVFVGPYTPAVQTLDLLGERFAGRIDLQPTTDPIEAAAREAWSDRLKGPANTFTIWHFRLPAPQGTLRGSPTLAAGVAQLANTATIQTIAGRTVYAGDMLGLGGQTVRVMVDAVADGAGLLAIEFQPRARAAIASGAAVTWDKPPITVMLKSADGMPTTWQPGYADGWSFEFIEVPT